MAVESWRFARLFSRLLQKIDIAEQQRYANQFNFFLKSMEENVERAGMRLVNLVGQPYDPGMAASAINLVDFAPDDALVVEQMIEPIIMNKDGVVKQGTIVVGKVSR
jgi:hypothetical protein